jgi:flagella basal body P-ring formation protein FlgA
MQNGDEEGSWALPPFIIRHSSFCIRLQQEVAMYGNGRPLTKKQLYRLILGVAILCWATQVLLTQWARGQEALPNEPVFLDELAKPANPDTTVVTVPSLPEARFIAARPDAGNPAMKAGCIELRTEASVFGQEVRLKQICRWSDADAPIFTAIAELIVVRFDSNTPFKSISMDELKKTQTDAKANLAVMRFSGPMLCTVRRTDTAVDPKNSLDQWIDARQTNIAEAPTRAELKQALPLAAVAEPQAVLASNRPPAAATAAPTASDVSPLRTLRQLLTEDLSVRLRVPVHQLQINFNPKDDRVLNLPEPQFKFNLEANRARNLGNVEWTVTVVHQGNIPGAPQAIPATQKVTVAATARAWQTQVLLSKPLGQRQVIQPTDVIEQRMLVDTLSDELLLTTAQTVGQQTSRDVKPGTVMTARMVEAVPLAKAGQYVTINVNHGAIRLTTAGRAMEGGSFGQVIRVRNEDTNETYHVQLTGPLEGFVGAASAPTTPVAAAAP